MLDLAAIQARCAAATPGPWVTHSDADELVDPPVPAPAAYPVAQCDQQDFGVRVFSPPGTYVKRDHRTSDNALFIAHARSDIPALLAEVQRIRELVEAAYKEGLVEGRRFYPCGFGISNAKRLLDGGTE